MAGSYPTTTPPLATKPVLSQLAIKQTVAFTSGTYINSASISRLLNYEDDFAYLGGTTAIVGPDGNIEAQIGGAGDGLVVARIDPAHLQHARDQYAGNTTPADVLYRRLYQ